jgi:uncharacterized protein
MVEKSDPNIQYEIGRQFYLTRCDYQQAYQWFLRAAEQGHPGAQKSLGDLYAWGVGITRNYAISDEWYFRAAEQGHPDAQYQLGFSLKLGYGVNRDDTQSFNWFLRAAKQGYARAQYQVGYWYHRGYDGAPKDPAKALYWLKLSAENGYSVAQEALGTIYETGDLVPKNMTVAVECYRSAAIQKHYHAQMKISKFLSDPLIREEVLRTTLSYVEDWLVLWVMVGSAQ